MSKKDKKKGSKDKKVKAPKLGDVEGLLYREADCLDAANLDAWIDLYTEDGIYWMPVTPEQTDPDTQISIFYEDRLLMEIRRRNFGDDQAASMQYDVRCSHLIGNIRFADEQPDDAWRITSNFQAVIYYRGDQTLYAGRYTHDLVRDRDALKIRHKRVDLLNCDSPLLRSIVIYL
jgi:benzoate/toluate 1,2-dioxygenase beta subunit